jgi:hypothetical protein
MNGRKARGIADVRQTLTEIAVVSVDLTTDL